MLWNATCVLQLPHIRYVSPTCLVPVALLHEGGALCEVRFCDPVDNSCLLLIYIWRIIRVSAPGERILAAILCTR